MFAMLVFELFPLGVFDLSLLCAGASRPVVATAPAAGSPALVCRISSAPEQFQLWLEPDSSAVCAVIGRVSWVAGSKDFSLWLAAEKD